MNHICSYKKHRLVLKIGRFWDLGGCGWFRGCLVFGGSLSITEVLAEHAGN